MDGQLKELLTRYGNIGGIWFDGYWDKPDADWRLERTYRLIHDLQPHALVGANHHLKPFPGEDFQMFEKDLPGQNQSGYSEKSVVGSLPLETCDTINGAWGYNSTDKRFKSVKTLIHYLVRAAGHNANFLLNVGPMPTGKIQPEFVERLSQVGKWLEKYGESIYETRAGRSVRVRGALLHARATRFTFTSSIGKTRCSPCGTPGKIISAKFLKDGTPAELTQTPEACLLRIPKSVVDEFDTVVAIELAEK